MKRRFALTYEQGKTVLFSLASTVGMLAQSRDPQLIKLRDDARKLYDILREYRWTRTGGP